MKLSPLPYILLLLFFLGACQLPTADRRPMKITAYESNPILGPGEPGSWDALGVNTPDIIFDDSIFFLFYSGSRVPGNIAIGVALSSDGYHFSKVEHNPVLAPDKTGFDAYSVGASKVVKDDSIWIMYYNALEIAGFNPGPYIGRAEAAHPTGPWIRSEMPVMTTGKKGEWDDGFVIPSSVIILENGNYLMYYLGGRDYYPLKDIYLGMAMSADGIKWRKYNDAQTKDHPFVESDPVLFNGKGDAWDNGVVWLADVKETGQEFSMYYTGIKANGEEFAIGFATSPDGIHWEKYGRNPVFTAKDDPYPGGSEIGGFVENPSLVCLDSLCLMFYDYSTSDEKIGVAVGDRR